MRKTSRRLTKRIITFVMSATVIFGALPLPCVAASTEFMWSGRDGKAKVETGMGSGTGTEGIWFFADDSADLGESVVILDHADPKDDSLVVKDEDVKKFGGISGKVILKKAKLTYPANIVIGFNIVGRKDNDAETGNASAWGGLSISYECDIAPTLELGLGDKVDHDMQYCYPEYGLSKAPEGSGIMKRIAWSDFKQPGWGIGTKVTGEEAATKLATVKFKISGPDGTYRFKIYGIGSKDAPIPNPNDSAITYYLNGGTNNAGNPVFYNDETDTFTLAAPAKNGYEFAGWFEDAAFTTPAETTIVKGSKGNRTFYAKWKKLLTNTDITAEPIADQTYTTNPIKPAIVVRDQAKTLVENKDYTVTYKQNGTVIAEPVQVGSYDAVISGKGDYSGSFALAFQIVKKTTTGNAKTGVTTAEIGKNGKFELTTDPATNASSAAFSEVADKKKTQVVIGDTVKYQGTSYKITEVNAEAFKTSSATKVTLGKNIVSLLPKSFKGSKVKVIVVKTKHLSAKSVKNAFKGSKAKSIIVYVKVGSKKENKKYAKRYRKIFTKSNVGKKVTVKY